METFSALLAICAGNSPVTGEFPAQRRVTRSFDVSFDLLLNKRLSKQSWGWWFGTPLHPLWRHCNNFCCFSSPVKQHRVWKVLTPLFIIISVFTIHRKYFFFFFMLGFEMYYPHYLLSYPFSQFIANNVFFSFLCLTCLITIKMYPLTSI